MILTYIFIFLLGAIIGSFLNVVIYRLPIMIFEEKKQNKKFNLALPHSHCPHCQHKLAIWQNIPIVSFLLLRGKCAFCQHKISARYFIVEAITAALSPCLAIYFGLTWQLAAALIFLWLIIPITFIDFAHFIIPDVLNYTLLCMGLVVSALHVFPFSNLHSSVIGAVAGYLFLFIVAYAFKACTKKSGMGHGDFKLLAGLGAWTGWQMLIFIILAGSILGLIFGLLRRKQMIPFGPFLTIAGFIALLYYEPILYFYWHLNF